MGFKQVVRGQMGKQDVKVKLFFGVFFMPSLEQRARQPERLWFYPPCTLNTPHPNPHPLILSPPLPGSCHGAVPSQLAAPLAGVASEDYERHYKV